MTTNDMPDREVLVLGTLRNLGRPIGEDEYHMIHKIMDDTGRGLGFKYEFKHWLEIDESFGFGHGAVPYSARLHEIIDGLVTQGKIRRNPDNPIKISYIGE